MNEKTEQKFKFGGIVPGSKKIQMIPLLPGERIEAKMSEKTEQKLLVKWFSYQYKPYKIIAIPNAQKFLGRSKNIFSIINSMIAEGFVKGTSDLFIAKPVGRYGGMWLEMKDKNKSYVSVEENQRIFIQDMLGAGYYATWAAGFENAQREIGNYMKGLV